MQYKIYHDTLADVLVESGMAAIKARAEFTPDAWREAFGDNPGPINYGHCGSYSLQLLKLKGKATRRFLQVSITRLDSGRYELTQYFL